MSDTATPEADFGLAADGGPDDLPRTLRRERDAREREAREREAREREARERSAREALEREQAEHLTRERQGAQRARERTFADPGVYMGPRYPSAEAYGAVHTQAPVSVSRLDIPFFHLMGFFIKAVLAGIPALVLLGALLWGASQLLQVYFPHLVKMQILILFPPN